MSNDQKLISAILAEPENDTHRLIYADWCEAHEDPQRAALIRAQCEHALLEPDSHRAQALQWQIDGLLARHGDRWRAELPSIPAVEWTEFERGLVCAVSVPNYTTLLLHEAQIRAAAPTHTATVKLLEERTDKAGSVPWLQTLRVVAARSNQVLERGSALHALEALELIDVGEYDMIDWLKRCKDDTSIKRFVLRGSHTIGRAFLELLSEGPVSKAPLEELVLGTGFIDYNSGYFDDPTLGSKGAQALAKSAGLGRLKRLDLDRQRIGDEGLEQLLRSGHLQNLETLDIRGGEISALPEFKELPQSGAPFIEIALSGNPIKGEGLSALLRWPRCHRLRTLALDTCEIDAQGARALTDSPCWSTLRKLDLNRNPLGLDGAFVLAGASPPPQLHTLQLSDCDLTKESGSALSSIPWFSRLLHLDLSRNKMDSGLVLQALEGGAIQNLQLTDSALDASSLHRLAALFAQLVHLDLSSNPIKEALPALLQHPAPQLQSLNLSDCELTGHELAPAQTEDHFPALFELNLSGNPLDDAGLNTIIRRSAHLHTLRLRRCGLENSAELLDTPELKNLSVLDLRSNAFEEQELIALVQSPKLERVRLMLSPVNAWSFSNDSRKILESRFGAQWIYGSDDEDSAPPEYPPGDDPSIDDYLPGDMGPFSDGDIPF